MEIVEQVEILLERIMGIFLMYPAKIVNYSIIMSHLIWNGILIQMERRLIYAASFVDNQGKRETLHII